MLPDKDNNINNKMMRIILKNSINNDPCVKWCISIASSPNLSITPQKKHRV